MKPAADSSVMSPSVPSSQPAPVAVGAPLASSFDAAWASAGVLLAAAGQGLAVKDADSGRYLHANAVLLGWLGREAGDVVGHTDADLFDAATHGALRAADQTALVQGAVLTAEHRIGLAGGPRELSVARLAEAGTVGARRLVSVWADLAAPRQQEAQGRAALAQIEQLQSAMASLRRELADQGLRDAASGLYAKAHFEDQLRREVDLSSREHREFSIVFVELDEASAGDAAALPGAALQVVQGALGRLLKSGTRAMDAACRLDERLFAVLLSGVGLATAHSRMEGLRRRCATEIVVHEGKEARFTVSMGVASFPHTAHTQAELLQACTAALSEAQRRGGNHVALAAIRLESS